MNRLTPRTRLCPALLYAVLIETKDGSTGRRYADQALDALRQAVDGGWYNAALTRRDTDLEILRPRQEFQMVLHEMEEKANQDGK